MKAKIKLAAVVFAAALLLCGCGKKKNEPVDTPKVTGETTTPTDAYSQLVGLLRDEVESLKKTNQAEASKYESKINELEKKISENAAKTTVKPAETTVPKPEVPILYQEKNGEITITGVKSGITVLVIPEKIDDKPVTAIADSAFTGTALTSVSIPSGVRVIGWFAFSGCVMLKTVTVPTSVEVIGYDAFANCGRLTVHCSTGSYAEKYTASYGISCVTE